ncbi:MAG: hypothetical protein ACRC2H_04085 [Silanimonas sp.]
MSGDASTSAPTDAAQDIKRLALQLAAVVDALERRSADAVGAIDDSRIAIARAAADLGQRGPQLVAEIGRHAQAETRAAADRALGDSLAVLKAQLDAASRQAKESAGMLEAQERGLARRQRSLLWVGGGALVLGSLLSVGGSAAWVAMKRDELAQIEFAQQIHDATVRGALVPCGESLCARVGESPRRAGERREFLVVE